MGSGSSTVALVATGMIYDPGTGPPIVTLTRAKQNDYTVVSLDEDFGRTQEDSGDRLLFLDILLVHFFIVVLGVHCKCWDIYKSSYNVANISYLISGSFSIN
jgi:hypothetical protein